MEEKVRVGREAGLVWALMLPIESVMGAHAAD